MSSEDSALTKTIDIAQNVLKEIKPVWRGRLHLYMFPIVLISGFILSLNAKTEGMRAALIIFSFTASMLFGTSALFHRGDWSPRVKGILNRIDHTNIYFSIAGTYTAFSVALLPKTSASKLLLIIWTSALIGSLFRMFWWGAPRWLNSSLYALFGLSSLIYLVPFWNAGGAKIGCLILFGGLMHVLGALVYSFKRPNPAPNTFGFHEIFHAFTIFGFTSHFIAIAIAVSVNK